MTTSEDEPRTDREAAEALFGFVGQAIDRLERSATADEARLELLADTQLLTLQAIYHELRHGHDQQTRQAVALREALGDVAGELKVLRIRLGQR